MLFSLAFGQTTPPENPNDATPTPAPVEREMDLIEKAVLEPMISEDYKQGEYLIYDCKGHYFACVNDFSFELCRERRDDAILNKRDNLPCAPLKKFKTQKECFKNQYQQIHNPKDKMFCIHFKNKLKK